MKPMKGDIRVTVRSGLTFIDILKTDPEPQGYCGSVRVGVHNDSGELYCMDTGHIDVGDVGDGNIKYEWLYRARPEAVPDRTESADMPVATLEP